MRRWIAVLWHASFLVIGAVLYFFFVLPRWFELTGAWSAGLGSAMRILCGVLIGVAALPVLFTLLKTRKPEFGTPALALTLRTWSIVLHVLAGALIVGAAISEFWVSLDTAGATLFGIYGAAAAIALLGALGFHLAYAAERPPPPPKPLRPKRESRRRGRGRDEDLEEDLAEDAEDAAEVAPGGTGDEVADTATSDDPAVETAESPEPDVTPAPLVADKPDEISGDADTAATDTVPDAPATPDLEEPADDEPAGKLRNRRPTGKSTSRLFGRSTR